MDDMNRREPNRRDTVSYNNRDEETAAEFTTNDVNNRRDNGDTGIGESTMGWIALALSIISYFWLPIVMGAAGIILGFVARNRDAETLGNIAIVAGIISIVITLFIRPFV